MKSLAHSAKRLIGKIIGGRGGITKGDTKDLRGRVAALKNEKEKLKKKIAELEGSLGLVGSLPNVPLGRLEYNSDGLSVWDRNLEFLKEPRFIAAYERGNRSGHLFSRSVDHFHIEWRVHVILWAAGLGLRREGDFVECGVNTGIYALAIADYHRFAEVRKRFFLFDTFCGTPEEQMTPEEREKCLSDNIKFYPDCYEMVKANFSSYSNISLVRGKVPDTLPGAEIEKVAYLSIDMNVAEAELSAMEYFWDKLVPGAPVVLDDYGWKGCEVQKRTLDAFAKRVGTTILTLPTGQGLLFKH
ncbi:MAG: class I SAM-dependent methyltransferase [Verrucomicrobiales bacterium]|nr:class I SAM-dependent methyltransferase [Verrucomicrobiales bacterium]